MKSLTVFILLTVAVVLSFQANVKGFNYTGRIYKGEYAEPGQFPYAVFLVVRLNTRKISFCGGTLIGENWVLTSAHCLEDMFSVTVYLGLYHVEDAEVGYTLDRNSVFPHPEWYTGTQTSDIALIQIPTTEYCSTIAPAPLPKMGSTYSTYVDEYAIAAGWGFMGNTPPYSNFLLWARMNVISNEDCASTFTISPSELCTRDIAAHCPGDSGGPLILESTGELIGVIDSMSNQGCEDGKPVIYTRVTYFLDWIESLTGISY